jgi:hypothetical protein
MTNSKLETETEVTNPTSNRGPDQTQPNIQSKPKSQPEQQPLQIDWSDENTIENLINDITANKYTDSDCRQILTELLPKILQKGSYRSNIYRINYYKNYFDVIFNYLQIVKYKNKICDGGTYGTLCYNKGKYPYAKDEQGRQIWLCGTHRNAIIKLNKKLAPMTAELFK